MGKELVPRAEERVRGDTADALPYPVARLTPDGRIAAVNLAWRKPPFGWKRDANPQGMDYLALCKAFDSRRGFPPAPLVEKGLVATLKGSRKRFEIEYRVTRGKRRRRFRASFQALPGKRGVMVTHVDLGPSASRDPLVDGGFLESLLWETTDGLFFCDLEGRLLFANEIFTRWFHLSPREVMGRRVPRLGSPEMARLLLEQNAETAAKGAARTFEFNAATSEGSRTFLVTKGVHRGPTGKVRGVFGIVRDISGIKMMEQEIIVATDTEKQRLGQELHENLCQYLVGISLLGNALYEDLLRLRLKQAADAKQIVGLVKESITEVRALVKGLTPIPLEEDGLLPPFQELAEQARKIGKIRCTLRLPSTGNFMEPAAAQHLFRIAQEAVHNAIKHSQATQLGIQLSHRAGTVVLKVRDNGVGFSPAEARRSDGGFGLGLHIMDYRSRALGAKLEIRNLATPQGGRGTLIVCTIPLRVKAEPSIPCLSPPG